MPILVAILLIILLVFGVTSGLQSYATARQAEAVIEVARMGHINTHANLIAMMTLIFVIVASMALAVLIIWVLYKRSVSTPAPVARERAVKSLSRPLPATTPKERDPLEQILELEKLRLLRELQGSNPLQLTDNQPVQQPENDPLHWLR